MLLNYCIYKLNMIPIQPSFNACMLLSIGRQPNETDG